MSEEIAHGVGVVGRDEGSPVGREGGENGTKPRGQILLGLMRVVIKTSAPLTFCGVLR